MVLSSMSLDLQVADIVSLAHMMVVEYQFCSPNYSEFLDCKWVLIQADRYLNSLQYHYFLIEYYADKLHHSICSPVNQTH